jgi:hypothetical protein
MRQGIRGQNERRRGNMMPGRAEVSTDDRTRVTGMMLGLEPS